MMWLKAIILVMLLITSTALFMIYLDRADLCVSGDVMRCDNY